MTLSIAWRNNGQVYLASDSRFSIHGRAVDLGTKVAAIPARVYPPRSEGGPMPDPLFDQSLGVVIAGDSFAATAILDVLRLLLPNIMVLPGKPISMDLVCELVEDLFRRVSNKVREGFSRSQAEFLLTGWCPQQMKGRVFHFRLDALAYAIFTEVVKNEETFCIGSGAAAARRLVDQEIGANPFRLLKAVIADPREPLVGGPVQCGFLRQQGFEVFSIQDYQIDEKNRKINLFIAAGGFRVYPLPLPAGLPLFRQTYLDPFSDDVERLLAEGFQLETI